MRSPYLTTFARRVARVAKSQPKRDGPTPSNLGLSSSVAIAPRKTTPTRFAWGPVPVRSCQTKWSGCTRCCRCFGLELPPSWRSECPDCRWAWEGAAELASSKASGRNLSFSTYSKFRWTPFAMWRARWWRSNAFSPARSRRPKRGPRPSDCSTYCWWILCWWKWFCWRTDSNSAAPNRHPKPSLGAIAKAPREPQSPIRVWSARSCLH